MTTRRKLPLFLALGALAAGVAAMIVRSQTRRAERLNPPAGRFVHVDGVRLHYVERGQGQAVVLLHGNGTMAQDFDLSGVLDLAAAHYRVLAFDRPGYGYSTRPRGRIWTPAAQAALFAKAFRRLGLERPVVVGHSWGSLVALALGLQHAAEIRSLVLLSGYYFPTVRLDVPLLSPPAIPLVGGLLRYTVSPLLGRALWPAFMRRLFGPGPVPRRFLQFPKWMSLRPSQIKAAAAESALMVPAAAALKSHYAELRTPAVILAGAEDRYVSPEQSMRLHKAIPASDLRLVSGMGHMVHHFAPRKIVAAIDAAARA
ncbi:MAG TPA: alpha/beta hydrolase [Burkholderiales bacterium]|nr:alpha/beta hydrolase [Burkholderiales bacterium]